MAGLGGDNPDKLPLINLNPTTIQSKTIAGNLLNAPAAFDLAALVNQFSAGEIGKMLERMMPGYGTLRDSVTGAIQSQVRGEIPKDVERLLTQRAAEKGVTLGTSGSGFQGNDLLRNLGLTSLDITQKGLDSAARWIASVPKAPQFDFTSMFFTPQQRLSFEFSQAQANLPIRGFNNWVDSLPSQVERGAMGLLEWGDSIIDTYTGAAIGGGMGGMGGGGQQKQTNSALDYLKTGQYM